jgi:hypothetical protein
MVSKKKKLSWFPPPPRRCKERRIRNPDSPIRAEEHALSARDSPAGFPAAPASLSPIGYPLSRSGHPDDANSVRTDAKCFSWFSPLFLTQIWYALCTLAGIKHTRLPPIGPAEYVDAGDDSKNKRGCCAVRSVKKRPLSPALFPRITPFHRKRPPASAVFTDTPMYTIPKRVRP